MTLAVLDCPTGLAGNMLLAALLDLGLPEAVVHEPLVALGLGGAYRLELEERRSGGLRGLHLAVLPLEAEPPHRHWAGLRRQLAEAPWSPPLRQRVLAVFSLLAEAEAAVHGHPPERVHFHEVGAIDALVDVVGVCAGLLHLQVEQLICTPPPAGHGTVETAHGRLPLPAPAVLEIARRCAVPLAGAADFPPAELTTPTGLALAASWADRFAPAPGHIPRRLGVGLGSRALDRPNLLRLVLADPLPAEPWQLLGRSEQSEPAGPYREVVLEQCAQIDDATPEDLAELAEQLREAGALEVFSQPITMKKGRPAWQLTLLAPPDRAAALRRVWWRQSTTLGLREQLQQRWCLPRRQRQLDTPLGPVRLKEAWQPGGAWRAKPEHDDLVHLARHHQLPLGEVRAVVQQALAASRPPDTDPELSTASPAVPPDSP